MKLKSYDFRLLKTYKVQLCLNRFSQSVAKTLESWVLIKFTASYASEFYLNLTKIRSKYSQA